MNVTAMAALLVAALIGSATSLAGLLMVAAVLQAAAVLVLANPVQELSGMAGYGITPFNAVAFCGGGGLLLAWYKGRRTRLAPVLRWPAVLLLAYGVVAAVGAWVLPRLFEGLPVNLTIMSDSVINLYPLMPSLSNTAQILNLGVLAVVLAWLLTVVQGCRERFQLATGVWLAVALVTCIGLYEQAAQFYKWSSAIPWLANNPGYGHANVDLLYVGNGIVLRRIGLPFTEPSYASAYLAAVWLGLLAIALLGKRWGWAAWGALVVGLAWLNSMGSTGLAAGGAAFVVLTLWVVARGVQPERALGLRLRAAAWVVLLLGAAVVGQKIYQEAPWRSQAETLFKSLIVDKAQQTDGVREKTNQRALEIVKETYGLGVGIGSHRASSFFAGLLANTGVLGFGLFMAMLGTLLWRYWQAPALTDMQIFVATALPTATLAMGLGIPDMNMPMYWCFIFLGFVFCPGAQTDAEDGGSHLGTGPAGPDAPGRA